MPLLSSSHIKLTVKHSYVSVKECEFGAALKLDNVEEELLDCATSNITCFHEVLLCCFDEHRMIFFS